MIFSALQDQVDIEHDAAITFSNLLPPITATIMLLAIVNVLIGNEKKYMWNWKMKYGSTRINATVNNSRKYVLITGK